MTTSSFVTVDECLRARPKSLTEERARSFLPAMSVSSEWQRKHDAGELPDGFARICGMVEIAWPQETPTLEEAEWILALREFGSWRWLASVVTHGDDNQSTGMFLIEAATAALRSQPNLG